MRKWFPAEDETFVFRARHDREHAVMILVPGGREPRSVQIDGHVFDLDEDMTEQSRMHIRVAERRRLDAE